eukprot:Platyproteum_vivax@DN5381_c0_g1_i1.p1
MHIFVTVGTTDFDNLIRHVDTDEFINQAWQEGYRSISLQTGRGEYHVKTLLESKRLAVEVYNFKPSLEDDMKNADLIISHAGAGSILEALDLKKRVIVVVNTDLMHNHQTEVADALSSRNHLVMCHGPADICSKIAAAKGLSEVEYKRPNSAAVYGMVEELFCTK